jgi:hypothetical protein
VTAGAASQVIRAPGRLVVDPADLDLAFPHGGTEIGRTRAVALRSLVDPVRIEVEGLGGAAGDVLEGSDHYVLACFLRGLDDDAARLLVPDAYAKGAVSGHAVVTLPGTALPGRSMLPRARKFLYVPDDPVHAPSLLIWRGVPTWAAGAEMAFQRQTELGVLMTIECVRNDDGKALTLGRLADLTLT